MTVTSSTVTRSGWEVLAIIHGRPVPTHFLRGLEMFFGEPSKEPQAVDDSKSAGRVPRTRGIIWVTTW